MARSRSSITTGTTENNIYFYPAGGHSHDGQNSSLIDATKYSVYDFNFGYISDNPVRRQFQINSFESLKQVIRDTVTDSVLSPAGIVLQPNTLNGATIIARTIEAGQIVANTLTANEISANTITADELASNIILVNNIIRSNNYSAGSSGWIIRNNGFAEFNDVTVRGTIESLSGNIGGWIIGPFGIFSYDSNVKLFSTGDFQIGSNLNDQATITSSGDFYVIGTDSTTGYQGSSRFYGPWFKIVQGSNNNANASTATQSQLTFDSLRIADGGNATTFTSYIGIENPSNTESYFGIVKNSNTEVYISNTYITASNAAGSLSILYLNQGVLTSNATYYSYQSPSEFGIVKNYTNSEVYIGNTSVTASNADASFKTLYTSSGISTLGGIAVLGPGLITAAGIETNGKFYVNGTTAEVAFWPRGCSNPGSNRFLWYSQHISNSPHIDRCYLWKDGVGNLFGHDGTNLHANVIGLTGDTVFLVRNDTTGVISRYSSTIKIKENINDLEDVGDYIDKLRPVKFNMRKKPEDFETDELKWIRERTISYGFIAEEVAEINDGHFASWSLSEDSTTFEPVVWKFPDMIAISIKELQSLRKRVKELESKVYGV